MKFVTVAGPPSCGKTSVILHLADCLKAENLKTGVIKFDCLTTFDQERYREAGIAVQVGLSGKICPDHFFISNIEEGVEWGRRMALDILISESAGLCNRCCPHITGVPAIGVIDNLAGVRTPRKIGPLLKFADTVVITKSDIVSQAEREVFSYNVRQINHRAAILFVNGISGQGALMLRKTLQNAPELNTLRDRRLRFTTPASVCSYCTGETRIGEDYQMGMMKKMEFR